MGSKTDDIPLSSAAIAADDFAKMRADNLARWPTGAEATVCDIQPAAGDFAGQTLPAVQFEKTAAPCDGFGLGVRLLAWVARAHREFSWRMAPVMPLGTAAQAARERHVIDTLLGSDSLRKALDRGDNADEILASWRA